MKFTINKTVRIYGDQKEGDIVPDGFKAEYHPPTADRVEIQGEGWGEAPPAKDVKLEDRQSRKDWDKAPNFGNLSISLQPGDDRIGEIYINAQYEGPNHQPDRCLKGLNAALEDVRAWVFELLTETTDDTLDGEETEIEIQADSLPCPKSPHGIAVARLVKAEVAQKLKVVESHAVENQVAATHQVTS